MAVTVARVRCSAWLGVAGVVIGALKSVGAEAMQREWHRDREDERTHGGEDESGCYLLCFRPEEEVNNGKGREPSRHAIEQAENRTIIPATAAMVFGCGQEKHGKERSTRTKRKA